MPIADLSLSYSDFQLNDLIDPDAFDTNNLDIVTKINELVAYLNTQTIAEAAPTLDANTIGVLLNNLAYMIIAITGKADWKTAPAKTIEELNTADSTHATAETIDHPDASITTAKIQDGAITAVKVASDVATQAELDTHTSNTSNPHTVTATQVGALVSIEGVSNPGGNIDLVGGTGITIAADDTNNVITITATGEAVPGYHMHNDDDVSVTLAHYTGTTLDLVLDEIYHQKEVVANSVTELNHRILTGVM